MRVLSRRLYATKAHEANLFFVISLSLGVLDPIVCFVITKKN